MVNSLVGEGLELRGAQGASTCVGLSTSECNSQRLPGLEVVGERTGAESGHQASTPLPRQANGGRERDGGDRGRQMAGGSVGQRNLERVTSQMDTEEGPTMGITCAAGARVTATVVTQSE